jgi:sulfur dioxygenase
MIFRQLFDQASWTYSYLIADSVTKAAVLVDSVLEQVDRDINLLNELGLTLEYCLETHVHADHITGAGKLRELTGCENIVPVDAEVACANQEIQHGDRVIVGNITIQAIATPGHTDSHMAYLVNGDRVLTGDALFIRGCGRTDFQSGDAGILYESVTQHLFALSDDTWVYPAHDYRGQTVSTIGEEKRWNPRFAGRTKPDFIEFMQNLNLPDPKKMMEAVPANQACGQVVTV